MTLRNVRECDHCHKQITFGAKLLMVSAKVEWVNGGADPLAPNGEPIKVAEICSQGCASDWFRKTILREPRENGEGT